MSRLLVVLAVALALSPATTLGRQPGDDTLKTIDALLAAGKYAEAEKAARARLAAIESDGPSESIEAAHVLTRLGDALLRQGRSGEETERVVERAAAIETRLEPGSRALGAALRNLASLFEARGDFARARAEYERAVDTLRAAAGPDDRETLLLQKDLAMAWKDLGEYDRARTLLESALAVRTKQDPTHVDVAVFRHNLGSVYWQPTWMERLYSSRLERGRSTADAVRDANQALLADRRRSGKSAHPIYWGGFVAAGD